jgi:hypothetical protein
MRGETVVQPDNPNSPAISNKISVFLNIDLHLHWPNLSIALCFATCSVYCEQKDGD